MRQLYLVLAARPPRMVAVTFAPIVTGLASPLQKIRKPCSLVELSFQFSSIVVSVSGRALPQLGAAGRLVSGLATIGIKTSPPVRGVIGGISPGACAARTTGAAVEDKIITKISA